MALDVFPQAPAVSFGLRDPVELPTVPGDLQEMQQQVQSILRKLDGLPFDTLGQDAHRTMAALETTLKQVGGLAQRADRETLPEARHSLRELRQTLDALQGSLLAGDSPLVQEARQALRGVAEAVRSIKALADGLDRSPEALLRGKRETAR